MLFFFFNDPAPTEIYTLPLHAALPIFDLPCHTRRARRPGLGREGPARVSLRAEAAAGADARGAAGRRGGDRKSTRLNSSHGYISYAVFCLKKKKTNNQHLYWHMCNHTT